MYALLQNQIEQFRKVRGAIAMKDYELAKMSIEELLQPTLERMAEEEPEKLGKLLTPERLARALTPEQFAQLDAWLRAAATTPNVKALLSSVAPVPPRAKGRPKGT